MEEKAINVRFVQMKEVHSGNSEIYILRANQGGKKRRWQSLQMIEI